MAFVFENQSNGGNLLNTIGIAAVVIALGVGTYFLFFTEAPLVDVAAPAELESISRLSGVDIDEDVLEQDPVYQKLGIKVDDIEIGEAGRENPFARF